MASHTVALLHILTTKFSGFSIFNNHVLLPPHVLLLPIFIFLYLPSIISLLCLSNDVTVVLSHFCSEGQWNLSQGYERKALSKIPHEICISTGCLALGICKGGLQLKSKEKILPSLSYSKYGQYCSEFTKNDSSASHINKQNKDIAVSTSLGLLPTLVPP